MPTPTLLQPSIPASALSAVRDKPTLFAFLRQSLHWPVDETDPFTYAIPETHDRVALSQILPFHENDPFVILIAEFPAGFRRTDLRKVLQGVRRQMREDARYTGKTLSELIFVCPVEHYGGIRFAHFEEREDRAPKLKVFGWDDDAVSATRTLRSINLEALKMPSLDLYDEPDWKEGYKRWMSAWNVESVTDVFFKDYRDVFMAVERDIAFPGDADNEFRRLFTQRLFNRLMFIHFLSKKRPAWLKFNGRTDYLAELWKGRKQDAHFYTGHLKQLFFASLNNPECRSLKNDNPTLYGLIGDAPYLNGGLFERTDFDRRDDIVVPDKAIQELLGLFARYNFTVTESTPDDIEVAVDPEMLGKVFEELVTGRHESGSYYTPRPVVSFMCREALKGYLVDAAKEKPDAVARFVDQDDPAGLRDCERVLAALKSVQVCDPACGSGAYLLGMLQELLRLRESLFAAKVKDYQRIYDRKLEIIQRNLYGVDKDEFAVNTAMLRLWLSLVVEDDRDALGLARVDVSLPNLRFKIQTGDSLLAPDPSTFDLQQEAYSKDAWELAGLHEEFFRHKDLEKSARSRTAILGDISRVQGKIENLLGTQAADGVVDWRVSFAEVFAGREPLTVLGGGAFAFVNEAGPQKVMLDADDGKTSGFDIVLANPPYIRQELIGPNKPLLMKSYASGVTGISDLYCYFYLRAVQLLRAGGMLVFISSNKWFRAGYGAKLRQYIADTCHVISITDFGELPVFQTAATFPTIFVAQQRNSATAQQRNSATAQQRNSATAQQRNSATAQQRNSATAQQYLPKSNRFSILTPTLWH